MATLALLRKKAAHVVRLPEPAQKIVDNYLHINVGGVTAACPYHINIALRAPSRAALGKGAPQEIEALAARWFDTYDLHPADASTVRSQLRACGIGVDCSGFATWVLNGVTLAALGKPLWNCLQFPGLRRRAVSKLRPVQNISANLLTGPHNARPLTDLSQIRPGDLLRVAGWHHVVVVIEAGLSKDGAALYFQYAQSSCMYGNESGVRTGYAIITNPTGRLIDQDWFDNYEHCVIKDLIAEGGDDSRAVRLEALAHIQ